MQKHCSVDYFDKKSLKIPKGLRMDNNVKNEYYFERMKNRLRVLILRVIDVDRHSQQFVSCIVTIRPVREGKSIRIKLIDK